MPFIDELTQRITGELHRALEPAIREVIERYFVGAENGSGLRTHSLRRSQTSHPPRTYKDRTRTIMAAVARFGEASIDDVAKVTGLDKRGIGSSMYYLAAAGKLKHAGAGKYKAVQSRGSQI